MKDEYITFGDEVLNASYIERLKNYADVRLEVSKSIIIHDLINRESSNMERIEKNEKGN